MLHGDGIRQRRFRETAACDWARYWSLPLQPRQQAGSVPALAAHLLDFGIELVDQCGDRKAGAVAARFRQTDHEILAHPFHRETVIEFSLVHGLVAIVHLPGLGGALRNLSLIHISEPTRR